MIDMFNITTQWESLDFGTEEEKAGFARVGIQANNQWLTEMHDELSATVKKEALLSSYHLAEWFAWNWWRLRYESKPISREANEWLMAHNMAEIGGGYIWPQIITVSDGYRIALISRPTVKQSAFRYLNAASVVIKAGDWESTIDEFIQRVISRLDAMRVASSNLLDVWQSVQEERACPQLSVYRRLEALLGYEPDEAPESTIRLLIDAQSNFGEEAVYELAASKVSKEVFSFETLKNSGVNSNLNERLVVANLPKISSSQAAWQLGTQLAKEVRHQLGSPSQPISNKELAELMAIKEQAIVETNLSPLEIGYALKTANTQGKVNLSGSRITGRRFDLARLLADHLMFNNDSLSLAASSSTYRQKVQRSFAAELLCPFDVLKNELDENISEEQQENLAEHFMVSPWTIKNILRDNDLLERNDFLLGDTA